MRKIFAMVIQNSCVDQTIAIHKKLTTEVI